MNDESSEISVATRRRARLRLALILILVLGAGAILWRFTPVAQFATPERLMSALDAVRSSTWAPLLVIVGFVLGGLIFFPLTVLIAATALMFAPVVAIAVSFAGTLLNAVVTYAVGALFLRGTAHEALGPVVKRLRDSLENKGVVAVAVIRMIPIAPFTAVNLSAGLLGVRLRDYVLGTALGVSPGILALTLFGRQLQAVLENPTASSVSLLAAVIGAWIGLSLLMQRAITRWRAPR